MFLGLLSAIVIQDVGVLNWVDVFWALLVLFDAF